MCHNTGTSLNIPSSVGITSGIWGFANAGGCVKTAHIYNEKNTALAAPFIVISLIFNVLTGAVLGKNAAPLLPHATP
jgi:hypothetical protein